MSPKGNSRCTHLRVTITPREGGTPMRRFGYTLSILHKEADGGWALAWDANMLTTEPPTDS